MPYLRARDDRFEHDIGDGVFVGTTADMLALYVRVFGVWEPHLSAFITGRLRPGDIFVDVGANSGWYTLLAALRVGGRGQVVAVEPSTELVGRLRWQVERNGLDNVRVVQEAVSDHVGTVAVELGPAEHTGLTRALREAWPGADAVACRPLPDMLTAEEWRRVRLVKIDVEGAEFAAVRGLSAALPSLPADAEVVVEVGPQRAGSTTDVHELFSAFAGAGFVPYLIPNEYEVRDYLRYAPVSALKRLDPGSVTTEVNVVFSRTDLDELPAAA
jgi:FkbM family methyltransferase